MDYMRRMLLLPRLPRDKEGYEYGTAGQIADLLASPERPLTADRIRDWARRSRRPNDRLYGKLPAVHIPGPRTGSTFYRLIDAARVEATTRPRRVLACDHTLTQ